MFYKFVPIADPEMTMRWQRELCVRLGLKGRIILSEHGINGTLGGDIKNLRQYKSQMNTSGVFRGIKYKRSDGNGDEFPRLSVKVRPELVEKYGDDVVFFDGRMNHKFSDKAKDIGQCVHCAGKTNNFENCADVSCNRLVLICENCREQKTFCTDKHAELIK